MDNQIKIIEIKFDNGLTRKGVEDCKRCQDKYDVAHFNCMYQGKTIGHSESHCTANACY